MQFPSLGSGNRFSCLSGQFQESKETDQGVQSSEKGLPPPSTEKSLRHTPPKKKKKKRQKD